MPAHALGGFTGRPVLWSIALSAAILSVASAIARTRQTITQCACARVTISDCSCCISAARRSRSFSVELTLASASEPFGTSCSSSTSAASRRGVIALSSVMSAARSSSSKESATDVGPVSESCSDAGRCRQQVTTSVQKGRDRDLRVCVCVCVCRVCVQHSTYTCAHIGRQPGRQDSVKISAVCWW